MTRKNVTAITLVNIENGSAIPLSLPMNQVTISGKGKNAKPPVAMATFALEPAPAKMTNEEKMAHAPDEMFQRVTIGLIKLDHAKRMQSMTTSSLRIFVRLLLVMMLVGVAYVVVTQFSEGQLSR